MDTVIALVISVIVFGALSYAAWLVFAARVRRNHPDAVEHLPDFVRAFWTPWKG